MTSVSREVAEAEVTAWLDKKKVLQGTRERYKDFTDNLIDAVAEGVLSLDPDTNKFLHKLLFPFGDQIKVESLTYEARLNDKTLQQWMRGVKNDDSEGRMIGVVAALTKTARELLYQMDTADKKIAMSIAIFFV